MDDLALMIKSLYPKKSGIYKNLLRNNLCLYKKRV